MISFLEHRVHITNSPISTSIVMLTSKMNSNLLSKTISIAKVFNGTYVTKFHVIIPIVI